MFSNFGETKTTLALTNKGKAETGHRPKRANKMKATPILQTIPCPSPQIKSLGNTGFTDLILRKNTKNLFN